MSRDYRHPEMADVQLHEVLTAVADPVRLELVRILVDGTEHTCGPMAEEVGISKSTLSHHLRLMREAGLIRMRPQGTLRWASLRLDELEERFPGLVWWLSAALRENDPAAENG